jgi:hypothetical protein
MELIHSLICWSSGHKCCTYLRCGTGENCHRRDRRWGDSGMSFD